MPIETRDPDFLWQVEEACANAYPAAREMLLDGWLLRAAGGRTRRINSVNPLRGGPGDPSAVIEAAAHIYAGRGQPAMFRVVSLLPAMDAPLARHGFRSEGLTLTLMADLSAGPDGPVPGVVLVRDPAPAWYAAWAACRADVDAETVASYRGSVDRLLVPAAFACHAEDGVPVAVAYAALHRGVAILESVVTHPAHRKRGHARRVVGALRGWARGAGAKAFCLQVAADNTAARALYGSLGFATELYRYHYRVGPRPPS